MPPRLNPSSFSRAQGSRTTANLALYGTIGLCGATSLLSHDARSTLSLGAQKSDPALWKLGQEKYARVRRHWVCSRANLAQGRWYTLVTSIWNHGNGVHFFGNMVGLWSFGQVVAYGFGAGTFLTVFYGGGVVGNLLCLALDGREDDKRSPSWSADVRQRQQRQQQRQDDDVGTRGFIGASGGVCAITAANACLNPWGSMIIGIMFIPVPVPNLLGTLGFAGFSAWAQNMGFQEGVAHLGHLGGLFYGFLWYVAKFKSLPLVV